MGLPLPGGPNGSATRLAEGPYGSRLRSGANAHYAAARPIWARSDNQTTAVIVCGWPTGQLAERRGAEKISAAPGIPHAGFPQDLSRRHPRERPPGHFL